MQSPAPPLIRAKQSIQLVRISACKRWIGSGVGAALMTACMAHAQQWQCDGIWLGVWEKNTRAIRFYRKWGFSKMGTQSFLLDTDRQTDRVLWLPLQSHCMTLV